MYVKDKGAHRTRTEDGDIGVWVTIFPYLSCALCLAQTHAR